MLLDVFIFFHCDENEIFLLFDFVIAEISKEFLRDEESRWEDFDYRKRGNKRIEEGREVNSNMTEKGKYHT